MIVKAGQRVENTDSVNRERGNVLEVHTDLAGEFRGMEVEWTTPNYRRQRYVQSNNRDAQSMERFLIIHTNSAR